MISPNGVERAASLFVNGLVPELQDTGTLTLRSMTKSADVAEA